MWSAVSELTKRNNVSRWERQSSRSSSRASGSNRNSDKTESSGSGKSEFEDCETPDTTSRDDVPMYRFFVDAAVTGDGEGEEESRGDDSGEDSDGSRNSAMYFVKSATTKGRRSFWREVPAVVDSGILEMLNRNQVQLQEAMFEVIVSEASYLKSLQVLRSHFMASPALDRLAAADRRVIDVQEWKELFKDVAPVIRVSEGFLQALDKRWRESVVICDICDILREYADKHFGVYVTYCSNQLFQDRCLTRLKESRPQFLEAVERLESDPVCNNQTLQSFLVLPVQRIMRLRLLVEAILKQIGTNRSEEIYLNCTAALKSLRLVCDRCNEKTKEIQRREETLVMINKLDFADVKRLTLASQSRFLLKRSEVVRWISPDTDLPLSTDKGARWVSQGVWLFLFTDLLLVARKKNTGDDQYLVLDYCARNVTLIVDELHLLPARMPECCKNLIANVGFCLLSNSKGKVSEMMVSFQSETEKKSFVDAMLPEMQGCSLTGKFRKRFYTYGDYPLMECQYEYSAENADELTLKVSDIVKIHCKAHDGWCEGERLQDGARGWFPANFARETVSEHVQAKNLRQRHHVSIIAQRHIEEQKKEDQSKSTFYLK